MMKIRKDGKKMNCEVILNNGIGMNVIGTITSEVSPSGKYHGSEN